MKITLESITKLRQDTGAGVLACKKALEKAGGNFAQAQKILQKEGLARAAKKADRVTEKGIVAVYSHLDGRIGVLVKLTCETDFAARNEKFTRLAHELCLQVAGMNPKSVKELLAQDYIREPGKKIDELVKETIAKIGENIKIVELARMEV